MLKRVHVPEGKEMHQMLRLRAAVKMNDEGDKKCGEGVFFYLFLVWPCGKYFNVDKLWRA